jgi:hypothetical protein
MKEGCRHRVIEVLDQKSGATRILVHGLNIFWDWLHGYRNEGSGHPQFGP